MCYNGPLRLQIPPLAVACKTLDQNQTCTVMPYYGLVKVAVAFLRNTGWRKCAWLSKILSLKFYFLDFRKSFTPLQFGILPKSD